MLQVESLDSINLTTLKLITCGTEKMSMSILDKLNFLIPDVKYLQTFGTSEAVILKTQKGDISKLLAMKSKTIN